MTIKQWFMFTTVFAFISFISFIQIDSYWSDAHHFNGLYGWLGIGILTGLISLFGLYKAIKLNK